MRTSSIMMTRNFKHSLSLALVLLCAAGLAAQTPAPAPKKAEVPADWHAQWKLARKNDLTAYNAFVHSASIDEQNGAFHDKMTTLIEATTALVQLKIDLASQPGAAYRDDFSKKAVMCQRSAVFFWQKTSADDHAKNPHFSEPLSPEVVTCKQDLAKPDPEE
jgi:hypothetical protein